MPEAKRGLLAVADERVTEGDVSRVVDWLGPQAQWPAALKIGLNTCLAASVPMVLWWGRDCFTFCNQALINARGLSAEQVVSGHRAQQLWPQAWREELGETLSAVQEHGESRVVEMPPAESDADQPGLRLLCQPLLDEGGRISGVTGTAIDDALARGGQDSVHRWEEEQHRIALESAQMGTWQYAPDTGRLHWSPRTAGLFNMSDRSAPPLTEVLERIHEQDRERVEAEVQAAMAPDAEGGYDLEYRVRREPGDVRWLRAVGRVLFKGQGTDRRPVRFVGVVFDTTETRGTQRALSQSERRFRVAQELSLDAFAILAPLRDEEGRIKDFLWKYANPKAGELIGQPVDDLIGRPMSEVMPSGKDHELFDAYIQVLETGEPHDVEVRYEGDGVHGWFRNMAVKLEDELAVYFSNITHRKVTEIHNRFLAQAGEALAESLDYERTLARVADLAVPELADWCVIDIRESTGEPRRVAAAHKTPDKQNLAKFLARRYPPNPNAGRGIGRVLRTGEPEWMNKIPDRALAEVALDRQHLHLLQELGLRSYICVPLRARGQVVGVITLVTAESDRSFREEDVALAQALAERAGLAVANAQLHGEAQTELAQRRGAEQQLTRRVAQQEAVAELGQQALSRETLQVLFDRAAELVASTLGNELAKVLELAADRTVVTLRAGVGWGAGCIGHATEDAQYDSQAGYTLVTGAPVISEDLRNEQRFQPSQLLKDHHAISGISVIIRDIGGDKPWGVLATHATSPRQFTQDDVQFLQAAANVLAMAIHRHRAERALRRAQERERRRADELSALMESVPAVVFHAHDTECWSITGNHAACAMLDQPPGANLSRTAPEDERPATFVVVDENDQIVEGERLPVQRAARGEPMEGTELILRFHDGSHRYLHGSAVPLRDTDGQPRGALAAFVDVTDRKMVERTLARERELFQSIVENIPVMLVMWDPALQRFTLNNHATEVLGWTTDEANEGDFMAKVYPDPTDREEVAQFMQSLEGGWREFVAATKAGKSVPSQWANIQLSDDTRIGIGIDLRERKQAERALRESEDRLSRIFHDAPVYIALLEGPEHRFIFSNPLNNKRLGHRELIGRPIAEAAPELAAQGMVERLDRVYQTGRAVYEPELWLEFEQNEEGDSEPGYFTLVLQPWFDQKGWVAGVMSFAYEVTEQVEARHALGELTEKLEEKVAERTAAVAERTEQLRQREHELAHMGRLSLMAEMASGLGHELNQPLSAIGTYAEGYAQKLRAGQAIEDDEQLKEVFDRIREQAARAGRIINGLRDFVRKEEPQQTFVSINELIEELSELSRSDLQGAQVTLELDLQPDLPKIVLGRTEIGQVLLNLIRNAMEAIDEAASDQRRITVRSSQPDADHLLVTVADTGPGVEAEKLNQIFQPFFSTKGSGMGIGLNICKTLVEQHDGRLWAENNSDGGLSMHMRLPLTTI